MGSMSNTTRYGVLIDGRRGGYGVVYPDLPGCTAMGRTLDEAPGSCHGSGRRMGASCTGTTAAPAGGIARRPVRESGPCGRRGAGGCPLIFESGKPAKANVSLDAGMLQAIDEEAQAHGPTRSAF